MVCLYLLHKVLWRWEHINIQMFLKHVGVHNLSVHVTGAAHILPVKKLCSHSLQAHEADCEWYLKDFLKSGDS